MLEVRLFATFRDGREKILYLDAGDYVRAADILKYLGIADGDVAILLINGRHSKPENDVHDGDVVALFPPVGGG